jgi:bacillithiol system protein YtxJ
MTINWKFLNKETDLENLINDSKDKPVVIFKHSTRCPVSAMALDRLQREWNSAEMTQVNSYFLDLISFRSISDKIAESFQVRHESPQLLVINNGVCTYNESHYAINYSKLKEQVVNAAL